MDVLMDYIEQLNWAAVLLASAACFAVNAVWYSKLALGKPWQKAVGLKDKDLKDNKNMNVVLLTAAITIVISTTALAVLVDVLHLSGFTNGAMLGALVAGGFLVTNNGMHKLFEKRSSTHFLITAVGDVVALAVTGGVLALFR